MIEIFLKFPLFYLANEKIQSTEIQNNIYIFWIFPLRFLLNFLVHEIKEWEFQKNFCHFLPYSYTYPGPYDLNDPPSKSNACLPWWYTHTESCNHIYVFISVMFAITWFTKRNMVSKSVITSYNKPKRLLCTFCIMLHAYINNK